MKSREAAVKEGLGGHPPTTKPGGPIAKWIDYPSSDEENMGETSLHVDAASDWYEGLKAHFVPDPNILVLANLILYYEEGNPDARRSPDIMVVKGVPKGPRRSFKIWEEKAVPRVIFEFASEKTWRDDLGGKRDLYERLAVQEYFLFDPAQEFLERQLLGFRLAKGRFAAMTPEADGKLVSQELSLYLGPDGPLLRGIDMRTGQPLLHLHEVHEEIARLRKLVEQMQKPAE